MKQKAQSAALSVRSFLGSKTFFWLVIGFFVFEALWITFSAVYPQAFDEDFHFGLILAYSHYWLPFLSSPPPGTAAYGAMTRDPSFMYHFLMSFPYRLIALVTHNSVAQIIALRILNVALFAGGLFLFRRLLPRVGISAMATNACLLIFVLIPIVPQVAGQVNYDNLLLPMTAWALLLTLRVRDQMSRGQLSLAALLGLFAVCMFALLVKYEFAPIFLSIFIFVAVLFIRTGRGRYGVMLKDMYTAWNMDFSWLARAGLIVACLISLALFIERDGVNVVRYHTLAPDCGKVLSIDYCSAYPVWNHDYTSHQQVVSHQIKADMNPVFYIGEWVYWLWFRLFFAINGPASTFTNYPPLPLPVATFALLLIASFVATIVWRRHLFKDSGYALFVLIIVVYLAALLIEGFLKYRATAVLELMNGRYLLPVLIPGAAIGIRALSHALRNRPAHKTGITVLIILLFLDGGGILTFITRSDASWDWQNSTVISVNDTARHIVSPVIFEGSKEYGSTHWFFN